MTNAFEHALNAVEQTDNVVFLGAHRAERGKPVNLAGIVGAMIYAQVMAEEFVRICEETRKDGVA